MMRRVMLAAVLAGCVRGPATPQQACERAADDDPKVKAILNRWAGNAHAQVEEQDLMRATRQDATIACLRGRGVIPRGGVERQKAL